MWLYPVSIGIWPGRGGGACNRELPRILLFFRDCPKSPVGARGVALQIAKKALVDPFRPPHDVRIHLRSVAQTLFGQSLDKIQAL
jgi:hypothetical protein